MQMISEFTAQIEQSSQAAFAGGPKMETYNSDTGTATAHSYARGWDMEAGAHLVSEFYIRENAGPDSVSIIGLNSFDVRRNIDSFDEKARDVIFKSWVTGASADAAAHISLREGSAQFLEALDVRKLGR
jgi:hypothetical protein